MKASLPISFKESGKDMFSNDSQPENVPFSIFTMEWGSEMDFMDAQKRKELLPMSVTVSGIVRVVRAEQFSKASGPINVKVSGSERLSNDLQEEKANCSILSSFAGKVKVGNFVHPLKAPALITTMFSGH